MTPMKKRKYSHSQVGVERREMVCVWEWGAFTPPSLEELGVRVKMKTKTPLSLQWIDILIVQLSFSEVQRVKKTFSNKAKDVVEIFNLWAGAPESMCAGNIWGLRWRMGGSVIIQVLRRRMGVFFLKWFQCLLPVHLYHGVLPLGYCDLFIDWLYHFFSILGCI